jgi:exopolysaccharide production protein ExoZ
VNTTPKASPKFFGLDVVRGFATCMVAMAHASYMQSEPRFGGIAPFGGKTSNLFVCVDFFFVLSGFLIPWVHWKDFGRSERVVRYFKRRFSRIYPVYWVALTASIVLHLFRPSANHNVPLTLQTVLTSYFVIPNDGPTILQVAWTIYYEVWGYLIFGAALLISRKSMWAFAVYAAAIVAFNLGYANNSFPADFFLSPFQLEFLMGIGVAVFLRNYRLPLPRLAAFAGGALFMGAIYVGPSFLTNDSQLGIRLMMGGFATLALAGMVEWERARALNIPVWLQKFGAASYSIYLVHTLVEGPVMSAGWKIFRLWAPEVRVIVVAAIAVAVGYLFHLMVELPLTELVKKYVLKEDQKPLAPPEILPEAVPASA